MDGNLNFYSVSSDGRVVTWRLVKVGLSLSVGRSDYELRASAYVNFYGLPYPLSPPSLLLPFSFSLPLYTPLQNELQYQDAVHLKIPDTTVQGPEGTQNTAISTCLTN